MATACAFAAGPRRRPLARIRTPRRGTATPRGRGIVALALASALAGPALGFDLQGHRGARGLAPENTLAAFRTALALGVTTLETDLAVTGDNVLVLSHDPVLNPDLVRTPDGAWLAGKGPPIHTLALADLKRYDIGRTDPASRYGRQFPGQQAADGERFPTLAELYALAAAPAGRNVRFNIETKIAPDAPADTVDAATFARLVVAAVRGAGMEARTTIQSFDWRTLREAKRLAPEIETVCLTIEAPGNDTVRRGDATPSPWLGGLDLRAAGGSLARLVAAAGCSTWSPFWRNADTGAVAAAHAAGLKVVPWTVDEPADMATLIDRGVDGLITDYPDRLRGVMAAKGLPLP